MAKAKGKSSSKASVPVAVTPMSFAELRLRLPVDVWVADDLLSALASIETFHVPNPRSDKVRCPTCKTENPCATQQLVNATKLNLTHKYLTQEADKEGRLF